MRILSFFLTLLLSVCGARLSPAQSLQRTQWTTNLQGVPLDGLWVFDLQSTNLVSSGDFNFFYGNSTGFNNSAGQFNTAGGYLAFFNNTTGSFNTAYGGLAAGQQITGSNNTAIGYGALSLANTAQNNTAVGAYALDRLVNNGTNIALGYGAGTNLNSGVEQNNIDIGSSGAIGDQATIRIGTPGIQTSTIIAGQLSYGASGAFGYYANPQVGLSNSPTSGFSVTTNIYYTNTYGTRINLYMFLTNSTGAQATWQICPFQSNGAPRISFEVANPTTILETNRIRLELGPAEYFALTNRGTITAAGVLTNEVQAF